MLELKSHVLRWLSLDSVVAAGKVDFYYRSSLVLAFSLSAAVNTFIFHCSLHMVVSGEVGAVSALKKKQQGVNASSSCSSSLLEKLKPIVFMP